MYRSLLEKRSKEKKAKREEIIVYKKEFSKEIIDEITALYDSGEKVADIIKKYNLRISPSQITYFCRK